MLYVLKVLMDKEGSCLATYLLDEYLFRGVVE